MRGRMGTLIMPSKTVGALVVIAAAFVSGCGMSSGSKCPLGPTGSCQSAKTTYMEAVYGDNYKKETQPPTVPGEGKKEKGIAAAPAKPEPQAGPSPLVPIKEPAHDIRMWVNNYRVDNTVVTEHYLIWEVKRGQFTLGRKVEEPR